MNQIKVSDIQWDLVSVKQDTSPRYCYLQKLREFVIGTPDPIGFSYARERYLNSLKEASDREG